MRGRLIVAFGTLIVAVACGGSSARTSAPNTAQRITIAAIAQRTLHASSARTEHIISQLHPRTGDSPISWSKGVAQFNPERQFDVVGPPPHNVDQVLAFPHQLFFRSVAPDPDYGWIYPKVWCRQDGGLADHSLAVNPTSVISSLASRGQTLERLGTARLRGIDTTHFRVLGAGPTEIWIDSKQLLRRIQQIGRDGNTIDIWDYFDYGVATPPITVPAHANPCPA